MDTANGQQLGGIRLNGTTVTFDTALETKSITIMRSTVPCSLVINTSKSDLRVLSYVLPSVLSSHQCRFKETLVVLDERPIEGRLLASTQMHDLELPDMDSIINLTKSEVRWSEVDYHEPTIKAVMRKWFGTEQMSIRCSAGTPIYAFLYGLEQAREDFRLHLDADMLIYDPGPRSWVEAAMEIIETVPEIMFAQQIMGPPRPDGQVHEFMAAYQADLQQNVSQAFSTRSFLFKMSKLQARFLPITPVKRPWPARWRDQWRQRSPFISLEGMITHHLGSTGMYRCDTDRAYGFSLHAWDKHLFDDPGVTSIIQKVTSGWVPERQYGQLNLLVDEYQLSDASVTSEDGGSITL